MTTPGPLGFIPILPKPAPIPSTAPSVRHPVVTTAERDWVTFEDTGPSASGKTRTWRAIGSGGPGDVIGVVKWAGGWRKYVFVTRNVPITLAPSCLRQIGRFLDEQTTLQRNPIPPVLCGIGGCSLTPHDRFTRHSWGGA